MVRRYYGNRNDIDTQKRALETSKQTERARKDLPEVRAAIAKNNRRRALIAMSKGKGFRADDALRLVGDAMAQARAAVMKDREAQRVKLAQVANPSPRIGDASMPTTHVCTAYREYRR